MSARVWLTLSACGLAAELLIALSTWLPGAPLVPQWGELVLVPVALIVFAHGIIFAGIGDLRPSSIAADFGRPVAIAFTVQFAVAWVIGLWSIIHIGGQPMQIHGHYYLNNHGSYQLVSHARYLHGLVLQQRIFTLIPSVFFSVATLAHLQDSRGRALGGRWERATG